MYTEPKIVTSDDLETRSYVTFYFNNKRIREYSGNSLNLAIFPNKAKSVGERNTLLRKLQFELHKALDNNCYPAKMIEHQQVVESSSLNTQELLKQAPHDKLEADLSKTYKRNLRLIHDQFIAFLTPKELSSPIETITTIRIQRFLTKYKSSGTYYMDRRRDLGVLISSVSKRLDKQLNCVLRTETRRVKLYHWARPVALKLKVQAIEFEPDMADLIPIIENAMAAQLNPLLGKHK